MDRHHHSQSSHHRKSSFRNPSSEAQPMPSRSDRATNLILTAAWNPKIFQSPSILEDRRNRLVTSLRYYVDSRLFSSVCLLDSTIDVEAAATLTKINPDIIHVPTVVTHPEGKFSGPSYLEALLYVSAREHLFNSGHPNEHTVKITGGYVVRNIEAIVKGYHHEQLDAMGFLHQNPLRLAPRYAMTSCMVMSNAHWHGFIIELQSNLEKLRTTPLESLYCQFLSTLQSKRGPSMPYPRLEARFNTSGQTSASLPYRLREIMWRMYSRTGLYVLSQRDEPA